MNGFGYIGVGLCARCGGPAHLFVASESSADQEGHCQRCVGVWLDNNMRPTLEEFPIMGENLCQGCGNPELLDSEMWTFTQARLADGTEVTVHITCTTDGCARCDGTYASVHRRNWNTLLFIDVSHQLFTVYTDIDHSNYCTMCTANIYEENGGEENYFECNECESSVRQSYRCDWQGNSICRTCYNDNVYTCDDCNEEYWSGRHDDCSAEEDNSIIHSWNYKPSPYFFGSGQYYLGFELEVESRRDSSRESGAEMAQNALGGHAYMKEDGSLSDGFEIVTHPHTLIEYQTKFEWDVLLRLKADGFRSWNTSSCGLHVHVSRTAFGTGLNPWSKRTNSERENIILQRQAHELRFMKLIYDNQRQVERISGRTSDRYASFSDKGRLVHKIKEGYQNNGRFSAVNTDNEMTIEVRVFKGSLRKERVLSAIEFVTASVEYTRNLKITQKNKALGWLAFAGYVATNHETYPSLALIMNETFVSDDNPNED